MKTSLPCSARYLFAIPVVTLLAVACGGTDFNSTAGSNGGGSGGVNAGGGRGGAAGTTQGGVSSGGGNKGGGGEDSASAGSGGTSSAHAGSSGAAGASGAHAGSGGASGAHAGSGGAGGTNNAHAGTGGLDTGDSGAGGAADDLYLGPTVGTAKSFAVLAYSAITTANISTIVGGDIGVSAGAVSTITGFDAPSPKKYGIDSLAPNSMRTMLAQQDVTALVTNIDPRPCDTDLTNVVGGLTGDITLYPGVTCMNSFSADVLLNGHVTLDALGNPNAFFIIRGNLTMTVADAAQVVLTNGAEACGVFWRISKQVTIGKTVQFYGTVISGTAITMSTASTLTGRALAQTAGVHLDANAITVPSDGLVGAPGVCTHVQ
jgi:hypothetical protein